MNWHGGHVGRVTWTVLIIFCTLSPRRLFMKMCYNFRTGFENMFKIVIAGPRSAIGRAPDS